MDRWICSVFFWQRRLWRPCQCSLCATEATLSFSSGPVCFSFCAEAWTIVQALRWFRQHQQVCHFSSFFRLSLCACSVLSLVLPQALWHIWQKLSFFSVYTIRPEWVPVNSFLPRNGAADELARRGALLLFSAIPCSLSLLISRIHSCLFSYWGRTISSKSVALNPSSS